jgi:transcriptional regulator with XRE-family HTH domain
MESHKQLRQFGAAVRERREALGLSQEDFAEAANLHRTYIGQVERAEKNVSFVNILRLAKACGVKPSELFGRAGM